jgi:hypothetical protein
MQIRAIPALMLLWGLALAATAEPDPSKPFDYIPFQGAKGVKPTFSVDINYQSASGVFIYTYGVSVAPSSTQPLGDFNIGTGAPILEVKGPTGTTWSGLAISRLGGPLLYDPVTSGPESISCGPRIVEDMVAPGKSLQGVVVKSKAAPGLGIIYAHGDVPPPTGNQILLAPPPGTSLAWYDDCVRVTTVVPDALPPTQPVFQIERLEGLFQQAVLAGWIRDRELIADWTKGLAEAKNKLSGGRTAEAREILFDLSRSLRQFEGERGDDDDDRRSERKTPITSTAVALLRANLAPILGTFTPEEDDDKHRRDSILFWLETGGTTILGGLALAFVLPWLALGVYRRRPHLRPQV